MEVYTCKYAYDFSTGIPLNLLIIYGKDPNFKARVPTVDISQVER